MSPESAEAAQKAIDGTQWPEGYGKVSSAEGIIASATVTRGRDRNTRGGRGVVIVERPKAVQAGK